MISKKGILFVMIVMIGLFLPMGRSIQTLQSAEWKLIGKDINDCKWFYDETNIKRIPENKVMVWLKRMVTNEEKKKWIQEKSRSKQSIEGYDRWAYQLEIGRSHV